MGFVFICVQTVQKQVIIPDYQYVEKVVEVPQVIYEDFMQAELLELRASSLHFASLQYYPTRFIGRF